MKLDKKVFYDHLKNIQKYKPITIRMRVNDKSNYIIFLEENRLTSEKKAFSTEFYLQILDDNKRNTPSCTVFEMFFDLIKENIDSDFKLYKFVNKKISEILEGLSYEKHCDC